MTEMLDIYDDAFQPIGTKSRVEVHQAGDWHRVFHCWVICQHEGQPALLLQRRSSIKDMFPDHLDVSAAGHYAAGETMADGVREVQEELGLSVDFSMLLPIGKRLSVNRYDRLIDRELADVFLHETSVTPAEIQFDPVEVAGVVPLPIGDGIRLLSGEISGLTVSVYEAERTSRTIKLTDFVPTHDQYYLKICLLIEHYLSGERRLLV